MNTHVINYMYYYWEDLDPHMLYYCYLRLNSWLLVSDNSYQFSALIKITVTKFSSPSMKLLMDQPNCSHYGDGIHIGWSIQSGNFVMLVVSIRLKRYI
jgi:hypothetical protein